MDTPNEIRDLAALRLEEAECLFQNGLCDGAFYLGGYAVELAFKAKICECLNIDDFYAKHVPKTELSKVFMVHNLDRLMVLSGTFTDLVAEKETNPQLAKAWSAVISWNEKARYDKRNSHLETDVKDFLASVRFIMQWIKQH